MVGTIFQDSATSLRLWFYAIFIMSSTRCGISAKQLERELGVTYKTAWLIITTVVPDVRKDSLTSHVQERVLPRSVVYTDEFKSYNPLKAMGYRHARIHHAQRVYVSGDVHTNTIEGFWALLKNGTFRYNNRRNQHGMFNAMVSRIEKEVPSSEQPS